MPSDLDVLASLLLSHREAAALATLILPTDGVAVVAGGYKGDTVAFLRTIYGPALRLYAYEPQLWAADHMTARFAGDPNVAVRPYGLGLEDGRFPLYEFSTDAASFLPLPDSRQAGAGEVREITAALTAEGIDAPGLDLLLLNVEGGEYDLLSQLIGLRWIERITYLLVQFHQHETMPYEGTRLLVDRTHEVLWDHGPAWVLWRRRDAEGAR